MSQLVVLFWGFFLSALSEIRLGFVHFSSGSWSGFVLAGLGFGFLRAFGGADGVYCFRAGFGDEDDGASFVAKCFSKGANEVFLVGIGKEVFPVDEEEEAGGEGFGLGGVVKFQAVSTGGGRLSVFNGLVKRGIEDSGGDFPFELGNYDLNGLKESVQVETFGGGCEYDWGVVDEEELFLDPGCEFGEIKLFLLRLGGF